MTAILKLCGGGGNTPFERYIKNPQILKISIVKPKKQICICLVTADHGGQKNRNGTAIFLTIFSTSVWTMHALES
jgi:hypothetical protein